MSDETFGLKFIFPNGESQMFSKLPINIGREADNDLVLADESVSAQHARITYDELLNDICIQDLDSLNGVFIDDQPTRKNLLQDGVKITLGQVVLTFRDTGYIHGG
jgi:SARP family transcriptional regulator, regulator of embCAB operon